MAALLILAQVDGLFARPLSGWILLGLAGPVLLLGDWLCRAIPVLGRFSIPPPVAGGLACAIAILAWRVAGGPPITFDAQVSERWWTWLVTPEVEWRSGPARNVNLPFLVGFFTCVGLNATWRVVRAGSWQLPLFWGLASLLGVIQNIVGISLACALGLAPLMGLVCGSLSLTGGHGTALGFSPALEQAGLASAATLGAAAATFGLVAGSLLGGPLASRLINRHQLGQARSIEASEPAREASTGFISLVRSGLGMGAKFAGYALLVSFCIKAGAWLSWFMQHAGIVFPAYMGALLLGVLLRNLLDLSSATALDSRAIDIIGSVLLGIFLATAMVGLNLAELRAVAGPMLVILLIQVVVTGLFAAWVTFRCLGRDYEAAVMAGGHCGFGLGATPNAVANMDALVRRYGPAPRAYTVVPPTGAFLIDFTNALTITACINLLV